MALGPRAWQALRQGLFALLGRRRGRGRCRRCAAVSRRRSPWNTRCRCAWPTTPTSTPPSTTRAQCGPVHPARRATHTQLPVAAHCLPRPGIERGGQRHGLPPALGPGPAPGASAPVHGPCARLDYELEMASRGLRQRWANAGPGISLAWGCSTRLVGARPTSSGRWRRSARFWQELRTSVSPLVVTMEALAPFARRSPPATDCSPCPIDDRRQPRPGGTMQLTVGLESAAPPPGAAPDRTLAHQLRHQYWTVARMLALHTGGGCNLQRATCWAPAPSRPHTAGSRRAGRAEPRGHTALVLAETGEERAFLAGRRHRHPARLVRQAGAARIGFGECRGTVLPAHAPQRRVETAVLAAVDRPRQGPFRVTSRPSI